jgi:hypothetical protein
MPKRAALKILNPVLAILMLSQLLSGLWHSQLSDGTFTWLHVRGGVALVVALVLQVAVNWDQMRSADMRPRNHISAKPGARPRQASAG